jgi:hypothetical protein
MWLLMFGAAWGISEAVAGEWLDGASIPHGSAILSVWAVCVLAAARALVSRPGFSTAIACVAVLFRLVTASPFFCHILGILWMGVAFDVAACLLLRERKTSQVRLALTGVTAALGAHVLFAMSAAFVVRNSHWVAGGWPRVADHIFVTGGLVALGAILFVPIGFRLGHSCLLLDERRPQWAFSAAATAAALLWTLGFLSGG